MNFKMLLNHARNYATQPAKLRPTAVATKFYKDYNQFYPNLIDKTMANHKDLDYLPLKKYCKRGLEYFTLCKLPIQAEFLVYAYELLEEPERLTHENLHQAYTIACATEAIQGALAIQDDKYDNSNSRAGKPAWHLLTDTSKKVANDIQLLRSVIDEMLRQNIKESVYPKIMDILNEMQMETEMGQFLDVIFPSSRDFSKYTMENYNRIAHLKAICYTFNTPLQLSLVLCNKASAESFELINHICNNLGIFIQINNDFTEYLDYHESTIHKYSSDFENCTCTWTAVMLLQKGTEEQKKIFKECYGSADREKIKRVIKLYDAIDMKKLYKQEEDTRYDTYIQKVRNLPVDAVPSREVFMKILDFFQNYMSNTKKFYYVSN